MDSVPIVTVMLAKSNSTRIKFLSYIASYNSRRKKRAKIRPVDSLQFTPSSNLVICSLCNWITSGLGIAYLGT